MKYKLIDPIKCNEEIIKEVICEIKGKNNILSLHSFVDDIIAAGREMELKHRDMIPNKKEEKKEEEKKEAKKTDVDTLFISAVASLRSEVLFGRILDFLETHSNLGGGVDLVSDKDMIPLCKEFTKCFLYKKFVEMGMI